MHARRFTTLLVPCVLLAGCYEHHFIDLSGEEARFLPEGSAETLPCEAGWAPRAPAGEPPPACDLPGDGDNDGDGFSNAIDCNDCSPQINPGAYDAPGNGVDEDCDGADDLPCDETSGSSLALRAASALGLCQRAEPTGTGWGVLSARITNANGTGTPVDTRRLSIIEGLGAARPRAGGLMVALSTGTPAGESGCDLSFGYGEGVPAGLELDSADCPLEDFEESLFSTVFDAIALEIELRVPTNVSAYQMASQFFTHEYPEYVCTEFNDVFVVLQGEPGALRNVVFDINGNPITVNNALLRACEAGRYGGREYRCELGRAPLRGTGFEREPCLEVDSSSLFGTAPVTGASTGCVQTVSRVDAGETILLRIAVWDTADGILDSLALVDGFSWVPDPFESVAP